MSVAKIIALAGAISTLAASAFAADFPLPPPPPQVVVAPVDTGWYLRGYLGMSNQFFNGLSHPDFLTLNSFGWYDKGGFDSAPFGGVGIGYTVNRWLRFDATGEYRGKAGFHALDNFINTTGPNSPNINTNNYTASKSEWVGLVNGYIDLGTWWRITPYVGAGAGFASIRIDHFRDLNVIESGGSFAGGANKTNFAWALHAGASYRVTSNFAVDFSYRYLNLGTGVTGPLSNFDPGLNLTTLYPMTFNRIQSHDLMFSVRWLLQAEQPVPAYAPPWIRNG
jgi:opacity protein-like surface antigen